MNDTEKKRANIFTRYAHHLSIIEELKLIPGLSLHFSETYICPICLEQFSRISLLQTLDNPLTLEDVPPKSLGGRANILTCKSCNNHCGTNIDHHLTEGLKQSDHLKFLPKSSFPVVIEHKGKNIEGQVNVFDDGTIQAYHASKRNNPSLLTDYIGNVKPNQLINFSHKKKPADKKRFSVALLKIGYLKLFERYGYPIIFDSVYNPVRKQLLNPEENIFPDDLWANPPFHPKMYGLPVSVESGKKVFMPTFYLRTDLSEILFSCFLPFPDNDVVQSVKNLRAVSSKNKQGFMIEMHQIPDHINCLFDVTFFQDTIKMIKAK